MIPRAESDHPLDQIRFGLMVAIGGEDATETLDLVKEQERIARRELEEVPQRAESRGPEFLEFSKESREQILAQLQIYLDWLVKARTSLEEGESSEIMEAYEESQEILAPLNAAMDAYTKDFANYGPYQSAPANTLARIIEGIATSQVPPEAWIEYCRYYNEGIAGRLESFHALELPGRHLLLDKYDACLGLLADLSELPPGSAQGKLQEFDNTYHLAESLELEMANAAKDGPTAIPATNVLLATFDNGVDKYGAEALMSLAEDYGELMDKYSENFEQAASRPSDSVLVQEEIPRTLDTLDSHYAAIEDLGEALETGDHSGLADILGRLKATAGQLEESKEVFDTAAQHQANFACPSCGRSNPPENRNCEACGDLLPRQEDAGASSSSTFSVLSGPALEENQQLEMTENVARLFQACDDVADGVISPEQFAAEVTLAESGIHEFSEELDGIAATALDETAFTPEQLEVWRGTHLPYLEEVAVTYQAGLQEVQLGLETMRLFLDDPQRYHLVEGIRLTWQGLSAIHRGRLQMETYQKMLDDVMEEAREEGLITEG